MTAPNPKSTGGQANRPDPEPPRQPIDATGKPSSSPSESEIVKPSKAPVGFGKRMAFALIVLTFIVLAAEIGLRLAGFQFVPPSDFALFTHSNEVFGRCIEFDPETLYRLKADSEIDFYGHQYRINAQGWRSPEFVPQKPPLTRRIVAIGDSNVIGYLLPPDQTFTAILGRLAGEKAAQANPSFQIEAINCGVLGWSSFQVRQALEHFVLGYEPDVLVVSVGAWNEGLWAVHTDREQWAVIHEINPRGLLYQSRLVQFIRKPVVERYRKKHIDELVGIINDSNAGKGNPDWKRRVPFDEFAGDVEWIYEECRRRGIQVIFLSPILRPSMEGAREALAEYQGRMAAMKPAAPHAIIDLEALTKGMPEDAVFLNSDPVHWRAEVHEMIAREAFNRMQPTMEKWGAGE